MTKLSRKTNTVGIMFQADSLNIQNIPRLSTWVNNYVIDFLTVCFPSLQHTIFLFSARHNYLIIRFVSEVSRYQRVMIRSYRVRQHGNSSGDGGSQQEQEHLDLGSEFSSLTFPLRQRQKKGHREERLEDKKRKNSPSSSSSSFFQSCLQARPVPFLWTIKIKCHC